MTVSTRSRRHVPDVVTGQQYPRLFHAPTFRSSAGEEVAALAELAGLTLDDWQQFVLHHALGEKPDGDWAARVVVLICPRQNGKNEILAAVELAGMFLFGERGIVHSAHEQATASEQFERVLSLIDEVPEFSRRMLKPIRGKGSEAIRLRSGQRIFFRTRTGGGIRGFSIDRIIFDEAYDLPETAVSAMVPTQSARPNTQRWYTSSAVDQTKHDHGLALTRQRERGLAGKPGIMICEWSAEGDDPARVAPQVLSDRRVWAQTNPAYRIRIMDDTIQSELDGDMGPREFAVERLGIGDWPSASQDAGRVIARAVWDSLQEHDPENRIVAHRAFAVDVNPERTRASIGVAGEREDGLWQFAVVEHRPRTTWLVDRCVELDQDHPGVPFLVLARGPAQNLIDDFEDAGLNVTPVDGPDYATACADFFDAVDQREVRYPSPQPELDEALAGARRSAPAEGPWTWSRKASTSPDISPLVTVTLALHGARTGESRYATVLFSSDAQSKVQGSGEDPEIGPAYHQIGARGPKILTPEDYTECFACKVGGCTIHS